MSCYHPITAYARERDDGSGKKDLAFSDSHVYDVYYKDNVAYREKLLIPCGQCVGCRLEYSKQWALRCVLEAQQYKRNYFLTLTYDDDHLKTIPFPKVDCETGEFYFDEVASLIPEDLTHFMKLLRRECEYHYHWQNLRFFACGEYGEKMKRPHFHIILFNCPDFPLTVYKKNFDGSILFNSEFIDKVWKKGYSVLAEVNYNTCAYVARYVMKKHKGKDSKDFYASQGLIPEFTRMSRSPGIGREYYESNRSSIYAFDEIIITDAKGMAKRLKPCSYYDRLYDVDNPNDFKLLKERRKESALNSQRQILEKFSGTYEDYLKIKEDNKLKAVQKLPRTI